MHLSGFSSRQLWSFFSACASIFVGLLMVWRVTDQPQPLAPRFQLQEETGTPKRVAFEPSEPDGSRHAPFAHPQPIPAWRIPADQIPFVQRLPKSPAGEGNWHPVSTPFFSAPERLPRVDDSIPTDTPEVRTSPTASDDLLETEDDELLAPGDQDDLLVPDHPEDELLSGNDDHLLQPSAKPAPLPVVPAPRNVAQPEPLQEELPLPQTQPQRPQPVPNHPGYPLFHAPKKEPAAEAPVPGPTPVDPHLALFAKSQYPSARECATCHQQHYEEWAVSSHGYACISPMFHKFEQKINELAQGTIGYFCLRCHSPAGVALGIRRDAALWEMPLVAREGVTCIVCHRVNQNYGKVNGERHLVAGPVTDPIYGPFDGSGVDAMLHKSDYYKVKTVDDKSPGQLIHSEGRFFEQLNRSEFCASCHQVQVHPGIKLEVVYEQYRASPAHAKGIQCQDCHMGKVPGLPEGYNCGAVAIVDGKAIHTQRKHTNHVFHGPGYSIAHPGIFPHNVKADRWSPDQWLQFDWRAGWGTEEFEDRVADGEIQANFPPVWREADDRMDAREVLDANLKQLDFKRRVREQVMENGSHIDGPFFDSPPTRGQDLRFRFNFTNTNEGHNLLTGSLGAQPQLWLNVALVAPNGCTVWESGYTDRFGDVADIHSEDVRNKRIKYDSQLFNLQTMFLITNVKGCDREFPLPVNVDFDQLPFIRPGAQPISVLNHPPFIRMEAHSLAPRGSRPAVYHVPASAMQQPGTYRLSIRARNRTEPMYFMRFCETTIEQQRAMNEGLLDIHRHSVQFEVR